MEKLVKEANPLLLVALYIGPVMVMSLFSIMHWPFGGPYGRLSVLGSQSILHALWTASMIAYIGKESGSQKRIDLAYALVIINLLSIVLIPVLNINELIPIKFLIYCGFIFRLILCVLMTALMSRVFYARSYIWMFIEFLIPLIGIYTLSKEVQNWEEEKAEEEEKEKERSIIEHFDRL